MAARRAGTGSKLARRTCRAGAVPWTSTRPTASPRSGRASSRRFSGQNPYVEQLTGSIRGDCLDHVIVLNDCHLKRMLASYVRYDHSWRTHRSLEMDSPNSRPVQPPELGEVIEFPEVHALQRHDERRAA